MWVSDNIMRIQETPSLGSEAVKAQKNAMKKRGDELRRIIKEWSEELKVQTSPSCEDVVDTSESFSDRAKAVSHR